MTSILFLQDTLNISETNKHTPNCMSSMFEGAGPNYWIPLLYFRKGELRVVWRGVRGGRANVPAKSAEIREGYLNVESHPSFEVRPLAIFPQSLPSIFEYRALQHVSIRKSTGATT